jgi:hypothetical protein
MGDGIHYPGRKGVAAAKTLRPKRPELHSPMPAVQTNHSREGGTFSIL